MTKASDRYPEDEFDAPPALDAPVGVHRAPRSWWSRWWPFVAVLVLVPSLTVGFVLWASSWDGDLPGFSSSDQADDPVVEETPDATDTEAVPEEEAPVETEAPPVEAEEPPAVADLATPVRVLNAANVSGLAGSAQGDLETAGFTAVEAGNGSAGGLTVSTVFYGSPELQVTAQQVADTLGITSVTESVDTAPEGVVVILLRDFSR